MQADLHVIVLHKQSYKEHDALVTAFSLEEGKVTLYAKGIHKTQSKLRGFLQLGAILSIEKMSSKGNIPYIQGAKSVFLPEGLSYEDLLIFEEAFILIKQICKQHQKIESVFHLLGAFVSEFQHQKDKDLFFLLFQIQLLTVTGFLGDLRLCTFCRQKFLEQNHYLSVNRGCICSDCAPSFFDGLSEVHFNTLKTLVFFQQGHMNECKRVALNVAQRSEFLKVGNALMQLYFPKN